MGEIAEGQRLIRAILTTQRQALIDLRPPLKHVRFNRATLEAMTPEVGGWGALETSGHFLGIPCTLSPLVPDGEVWATSDFRHWQILRTGG